MSTPAKQGTSRPAKNSKRAQAKAPAKKAATRSLQSVPTPKEPKPVKHCLHGCGQVTKGDFAVGHDAKLKSILQKAHVAGETKVDLGDSPLSGQAPMAIAKQRGWESFLDKAKQAATEKANRPKRTPKVKTKGGPLEVGATVEFNYRGSKRTGKVTEIAGDRARVEFVVEGKTESRPFGRESLTTVK